LSLPIPRFSVGRLIKLAILVAIVWVFVIIARTGLWQVPIISSFVQPTAQPLRAVEVPLENPADLVQRMQGLATGRTLVIREAELTVLVQQGASKLSAPITDVAVVTVSETAGELEFSFRIPKRHNALVRLWMLPSVNDAGDLFFTAREAKVGDVRVPTWSIGGPTKLLLTSQLEPILRVAPPLEQVSAADGALRFTFAQP
jgi:hypothetical protein